MPKVSQLLHWSKQVPLRSMKCLFLNKMLNWYELLFAKIKMIGFTDGGSRTFLIFCWAPRGNFDFWTEFWAGWLRSNAMPVAEVSKLRSRRLPNLGNWHSTKWEHSIAQCMVIGGEQKKKRSKIGERIPTLEGRHPLVTWKGKGVFFFGIPVRFIYGRKKALKTYALIITIIIDYSSMPGRASKS